jgi:hypothetical protein
MGHPYGVQPEHIARLAGDTNAVRDSGLGRLAQLSDEAVLCILNHLAARDLAALAAASRALYCFANHEELWKALALEELPGRWRYRCSWQETYLAAAVPGYRAGARRPRPVRGLYSDLLHQSWLCAALEVDPAWLEVDNVERRAGLSVAEFRERYERPNRPVILTDVVPRWRAFAAWDRPYLQRALGGADVLVGDAPMPFAEYCAYADAQRDELPLYLFDKNFAAACPALAGDYSAPPHFSEDLFAVLGDARPDYRWLIIGPPKSGSTFHVDPNATSAWNAVVRGAKKWVLYPPGGPPPPGVRPSADGADVASPVSLMEWFLSFYDLRAAAGAAPAECTLRAGELLFVPRGWWHTAINLEETVAVTQNYVSQANLAHVAAFLARPNAAALVSGVGGVQERETLHARFLAALEVSRLCGGHSALIF